MSLPTGSGSQRLVSYAPASIEATKSFPLSYCVQQSSDNDQHVWFYTRTSQLHRLSEYGHSALRRPRAETRDTIVSYDALCTAMCPEPVPLGWVSGREFDILRYCFCPHAVPCAMHYCPDHPCIKIYLPFKFGGKTA